MSRLAAEAKNALPITVSGTFRLRGIA